MKKPWTYALSVVLSLLLIFSYIGLIAGGLMKFRALRAETALKLVESEELAQKVHDSLEAYYKAQENVSGITPDTYEDAITVEALEPIINAYIESGFGYVNGTRESISATANFGELESDVTSFFVRYANEYGYAHDGTFDAKVQETIEAAKQNILTSCDIYHFGTLEEAGFLGKLRKVAPLANYLLIGCVIVICVLLLALLILYRKEPSMLYYWTGSSVLAASVLMLIPAAWLQSTRWFDRFAVKEDAVFSAVTGYLYTMTGSVIAIAIIGIGLAAALYLLLGITSHASPDKARKEAKRQMEEADEEE